MKRLTLLSMYGACILLLLQSCKKNELPGAKPVGTATKLKTKWVEGTAADPWIMTYNGNYYMIYNKDWNHITVRVAPSILGLANAPDQYLYSASQNPAGIAHGVGGGS